MACCSEGKRFEFGVFVELPQCFLLTDDILVVENRMLPIAIRLSLLFFYLLFHVDEHLKELIFMLQYLDTRDFLLRRGGVDVLSGT